MNYGEIVGLGVIQGLTEFLPISSSGHLLAARFLLGISDAGGTALDAFLHLGTLLAVLVYYWWVWWGMVRGLVASDAEARDKRQLLAKLVVATVPAAAVGWWFQDEVARFFRTPNMLAGALVLTAVVLWWFDREDNWKQSRVRADWRKAIVIGLAQIVALVPGVSRSGITISAGRALGLSRKQATNFSFLMSAPIIAGAGLTSLRGLLSGGEFPAHQLLVGLLVAFISGLAAIAGLLKIIEKISFKPFAIYLVLLAVILLMS